MINPNIKNISEPPIPLALSWSNSYNGKYGDVIDMSQAVPSYPPHIELQENFKNFSSDISLLSYGEIEGPHAQIGADIAKKYKISRRVTTCIAEHHDDEMSSVESFLVAAADALSAARPGSRRDTLDNYVKRMEELEEVAGNFEGINRCFAIQAGREVRIMVEPDVVDDVSASELARDIVKSIEEKLAYPGQIKVVVIREKRSVQYAK